MERIKRNGRMSVIVRILTASPNKIFTLSYFCGLFDAAKSTISEDIDLIREVFTQYEMGHIETVTGAAGGVRYQPRLSKEDSLSCVAEACRRLGDPTRVLPGGYIYMGDILSDPAVIEPFAQILAGQFYEREPDFVLTVETRGISLATCVARAIGVPLVIARRDQKALDGSQVTINFLSGSTGEMQTMSLVRRAAKPGQRTLIIDDFMKAGGTMRGMMDLMREFSVQVIGAGVMIQRRHEMHPKGVKALMTIESIDPEKGAVVVPEDR